MHRKDFDLVSRKPENRAKFRRQIRASRKETKIRGNGGREEGRRKDGGKEGRREGEREGGREGIREGRRNVSLPDKQLNLSTPPHGEGHSCRFGVPRPPLDVGSR